MMYMGKEYKKEWIYVQLIHFAVHLKHNTVNQLYFKERKKGRKEGRKKKDDEAIKTRFRKLGLACK